MFEFVQDFSFDKSGLGWLFQNFPDPKIQNALCYFKRVAPNFSDIIRVQFFTAFIVQLLKQIVHDKASS